jgi:hypothetical protein
MTVLRHYRITDCCYCVPPLQVVESTRIDVARNVGTALAAGWPDELPVPVGVPLLVPTASVVPLVPIAAFVEGVAG